jgi:hypothetical protein
MRLATRYIWACAVIMMTFITYQIYIFNNLSWIIPINTKSTTQRLSESTLMESNKVLLTAKQFRSIPNAKTGNPLIDDYGRNDRRRNGEVGRGVTFVGPEKIKVAQVIETFHLNVYASDLIPLNRMVPDSRPQG